MFEVVYQFDPTGCFTLPPPGDSKEARQRLDDGNRQFAVDLDPRGQGEHHRRVIRVNVDALGLPTPDGQAPQQQPFAAILGCADARVPVEMLFGQGCNDIFVVRVAGNVLGSECLGSLDYALTNLGTRLKTVVVLGHTRCGAVTAAVDSFLNPTQYLAFSPSHPQRAIVDRLLVPTRAASMALERGWGTGAVKKPGYRDALIATTVTLNAAFTAASLRQEFRDYLGGEREVVYGIYDLLTRRVGIPLGVPGESNFTSGLVAPPADLASFDQLGIALATAPAVRELLLD
ncbi:MAG TPA: carbonic anhydrase [Gemmataceae bacterium]